VKKLYLLLFVLLAFTAFGQEKYALVIGNSHYTNFGTLQNPVNDAKDMADTLKSLGFNVDLVQDATLTQMENSVIELKNRLSDAGNDSIGFFYYAGHGVEKDGVNYLIPADANIPDSIFLRERAFSVQIMLDALNDSRNALNIIVLDACRSFPSTWSRSLDRGLTIIPDPPANHIIMYATGAGKVALDGTGRNGLFTSYLLNNLRQPDLDVNDVFRHTMGDVAQASNNEQRPALYTDFSQTLYLNEKTAENNNQTLSPPIAVVPNQTNPSSATPFPNGLHYSTGRKVGAGFLNLLCGAGSFSIGDRKGGLTILGLEISALGMIWGGVAISNNTAILPGFLVAAVGSIIMPGAIITGFVIPFSYDIKISKEAGTYYADSDTGFNQNPMNNLSIIPVPTSSGNMGMGVLYKTSF